MLRGRLDDERGGDQEARQDRPRERLRPIATGIGDSFSISTIVIPSASATLHTRWTTSPLGTRTRVSVTGVPSIRRCRTDCSSAGTCHLSSAATYQFNGGTAPHGSIAPHAVIEARQSWPVTPVVITA